MTWLKHKTDPASLWGVVVFILIIFYALHIDPRRCRYTARVMFHSALVFQGNLLTLSQTQLPRVEF